MISKPLKTFLNPHEIPTSKGSYKKKQNPAKYFLLKLVAEKYRHRLGFVFVLLIECLMRHFIVAFVALDQGLVFAPRICSVLIILSF